jgi:hypothetical protein
MAAVTKPKQDGWGSGDTIEQGFTQPKGNHNKNCSNLNQVAQIQWTEKRRTNNTTNNTNSPLKSLLI